MKTPVVIVLLILVVGPSTFLGGAAISEPVSARDSQPNPINSEGRHVDADAIKQTHRSLRSNAIQSELSTTDAISDIENSFSSSSNDSASTEGMQALQTPIIGQFSGSYNLQFTQVGFPPGFVGHVIGTMAGPLSSLDGIHYSPTGDWEMSYDFLGFDHGSGIPISHTFSGSASSVCGGSVHSICMWPLGYLEYDAASNTFLGEIIGHDSELGAPPPLLAPAVSDIHPLKGSDSRSGGDAFETSSWTFIPGPDQCIPPEEASGQGGNIEIQQETDCKPTITIQTTSVNPYPSENPSRPEGEIEIRAFVPPNTPLRNIVIEVKACTEVGAANTDGHTHDRPSGDPCFMSSRPHPSLNWYCCEGSFPQPQGNPITVVTDSNGIARIKYHPPQSTVLGKPYYISGQDKIVATLTSDTSVKNDKGIVRTMVPGLEPMFGSANCRGGGTFVLIRQPSHDPVGNCLFFYGTPQTNNQLVAIANEYVQRQIDCAAAAPRFNREPSCQIDNGPGSPGLPFVRITEDPIPMRITAMSLPWGGLSDINRNWRPPHGNHNDGKSADLSFRDPNDVLLPHNDPRIRLLRDVILDSGADLPVPHEGRFLPLTSGDNRHFHVRFTN